MKEKLKALFDARSTWATIGVVAGGLLGQKAVAIVAGLGELVMAIL